MKSLSEIGRQYGIEGRDVRIIAEAHGVRPTQINRQFRILTDEQVRKLEPYLQRAATSREAEKVAVS